MDYLLDSKGQKVKVYDLRTVLYPDHAIYDGRHLLPNVYDCRAFGCGCGAPSGMEMPFDKAKETFNGLREDMRCHIQMLADVVFKDGVNWYCRIESLSQDDWMSWATLQLVRTGRGLPSPVGDTHSDKSGLTLLSRGRLSDGATT